MLSLNVSSRTCEDDIQILVRFYRLFHPTEIDFILDLNSKFSQYENTRISLITAHLRAAFKTNHSEADVRSLIIYFTSPCNRLRLRHSINLKSIIMSNAKNNPIEPYTNVCPECHQILTVANAKTTDISLYSSQGKVIPACVYSLYCNHASTAAYKHTSPVTIYSNFYTQEKYNYYTSESLQFGDSVYIGGSYASDRDLVERYICDLMGTPHSWLKTADSLNLQAFNRQMPQLTTVNRKRLAQIVFICKVVETDLCLGSKQIKVPQSLKHFDQWAWDQYYRLFSRFVYVWTNHRTLIGPCSDNCTNSFTVDGHQKSRRRVCRAKEVNVISPDFADPLVIGCCRTPVPRSLYCNIHQDQHSDEDSTTIKKPRSLSSIHQQRHRRHGLKKKSKAHFFGATNCNTSKARSKEYVRRCSRSFGLLAMVTNCQIITSFSEIFRTETLREIIQLLINTIRIAGESVPNVACYDDGCHLVQYIQNHIGDRIIDSPYSQQLKRIKFSIDKAHWHNHVGDWCKKNMSPYSNKDLDNCNTQVAEQLFSWLKRYSPIISSLGWLRAPVYLLLLFHYKNLETTKTRPTHHFDIADSVPDVPHASLTHAANNQFLAQANDLAEQHINTSAHSRSFDDATNDKAPVTPSLQQCITGTINKWTLQAHQIHNKRYTDSIHTTIKSSKNSTTPQPNTNTPCTDFTQTSIHTSKWTIMTSRIRKDAKSEHKNDVRSIKRRKHASITNTPN